MSISEISVVRAVHHYLIKEGYTSWVDSRLKKYGLRPTHNIRIGGRIPDIIARKGGLIVAIECKGERGNIKEAIGQTTYYALESHKQYIALPIDLFLKEERVLYKIADKIGVGVLVVRKNLEVFEEISPRITPPKYLEQSIYDVINILKKPIDVNVYNIGFSRPEPIIITLLLAAERQFVGSLVNNLMRAISSAKRKNIKEEFARRVLNTAIMLDLLDIENEIIAPTAEGKIIIKWLLSKAGSVENALKDILSIYSQRTHKYYGKISHEDIKLIASIILLRHPTVRFIMKILYDLSFLKKRGVFTSREIIEHAKQVDKLSFMRYFVKKSVKKDPEEINFYDIDPRVYDDIKAQMRNAGLIKGPQGSKKYPDDLWEILL